MNDSKRILFIINPISGIGKKNTIPPLIRENLDHAKFVHDIVHTERKRHGHEIALAEKANYDVIVAVGGDGSVNEIGSALIGSKCALAILPCGSGNGLARHSGVPLKLEKAIGRINLFLPEQIDTGTINGHPFIGTCGFGFDGYIARKFDEFHQRGFLSYVKLVLREYLAYRPEEIEFQLENETLRKKGLFYAIANGSEFGNNFTISPDSYYADEKMELVIIQKFSLWRSPVMALKFFTNRINTSRGFELFDVRNTVTVKTTSGKDLDFHVDGEPAGKASSFKIEVRPSSLVLL
jgi:diacylglycerol kinase (ATP)